jgi:hypothetical protein
VGERNTPTSAEALRALQLQEARSKLSSPPATPRAEVSSRGAPARAGRASLAGCGKAHSEDGILAA